MGKLLALTLANALLASASCASSNEYGHPSHAVPPNPSASGRREAPLANLDKISILEWSNVCVSVLVDERIWPRPLTTSDRDGFSYGLTNAMRRLHESRGGSSSLPGPDREPRFVASNDYPPPACRDRGEDIFVIATYRPRSDDGPFVMDYRIEQGTAVRSGSFTRDIREELRRGQLPYVSIMEPISSAIYDDIQARAQLILDQIQQ